MDQGCGPPINTQARAKRGGACRGEARHCPESTYALQQLVVRLLLELGHDALVELDGEQHAHALGLHIQALRLIKQLLVGVRRLSEALERIQAVLRGHLEVVGLGVHEARHARADGLLELRERGAWQNPVLDKTPTDRHEWSHLAATSWKTRRGESGET